MNPRLCLWIALAPFAMAADDEAKKPWSNETDFSAVWTRGNSESTTIGFKNEYAYHWDQANFTAKAGAINAESARIQRVAVGTADDFQIIETKDIETTDEKYNLNLKYDRNIKPAFYWFAGLDWDRNEFAGIDNRYSGSLGVGNIWADSEKLSFKTDYGAQYTKEDRVIEDPDQDDAYASARLSSELKVKIGATSNFKQTFDLTANMEETDDFRFELDNAVTAKIDGRLALRASLLLVYDNVPTRELIPLNDSGSVLAEVDDLDTVFTASLVVTF